MAAVPYHIILKEVEKVKNCSFNLFGNSLFSLSNSNIFASAKNCRSKSKIIELASAIVWNTLATKLYMLARGHWFPVYGLRNECAWRYFLQEKDVPTESTLDWIKVSGCHTKPRSATFCRCHNAFSQYTSAFADVPTWVTKDAFKYTSINKPCWQNGGI